MEQLRITVDGKTYHVVVEKLESAGTTTPAPAPAAAPAPAPVPSAPVSSAPVAAAPAAPVAAPKAAAAGDTLSPLAGIIQAIALQVGSAVNEGDLVVTLEAMKMYTPINATSSGTLTAVHVKIGDAVEEGQPLFTIG
jgi:glutaconyl-CoA/methylmalonyl-CoA decarboxylase subunit gamma